MKKWIVLLLLLAAMAGLAASAAAENPAEPEDEWTVMFYFCGSDLESKHGYASGNLNEMTQVRYPTNFAYTYLENTEKEPDQMPDIGKVNIVIETGGSRKWNMDEYIGIDISTDKLQRWYYPYHPSDYEAGIYDIFKVVDEKPLQSMADPETLTDFISWSAKKYPAKKYALVLWDHGGGAGTGLFVDELYDGDIMYLYELKEAMANSGVYLETVVIDACLMASIETAWTLKDYAHWMVASEEVVPGKGTAVSEWLQNLVAHPNLDGEWLGRCICDTTNLKYANEQDEISRALLTWSVIDLTKIDRLMEVSMPFFELLGDLLVENPDLGTVFSYYIFDAIEFGDSRQDMRDFGNIIYNKYLTNYTDLRMTGEIMQALQDAVVYHSSGFGRAGTYGLSFCYPADFTGEEMDHYARNFPIAPYLAYLDAITAWTAPDWVYEQTKRLPEIDTIKELKVNISKEISPSGMPALLMHYTGVRQAEIYYRLYRLDEGKGEKVRLGRIACSVEYGEDKTLWRAGDPMHWPAVDGSLCCIDLVQDGNWTMLYNIPVQINSDTALLRCGRDIDYEDDVRYSEYEVYGVWEGYDENSRLMNRSVEPLAMQEGREIRMLYPIYDPDPKAKTRYMAGNVLNLQRSLLIEEIPLPAGTYYLEYELVDMFMRSMRLEQIEIQWDGEKMTFPDDFVWEGTVDIQWSH